ncbi:MAG: hypothetical protein A3F35_02025 [Candidatus Woykebacteria bacterium RIFCSPHIGHO2_12_FULL_45_10]|uniref:Response regulatory domain-containing protein n=1 Tax=Candidatus Woykebacteria bacterium RIFCSPHIGHO2_12_FULL_45_10 TaxID=1802603 RepID=A0A1G1WN19_9BACT|nr:MAG: hypothetical protein A3F35_02025 [Candidatus Woykebacteria bacterium RIFCSPHIGHO2_12_FULL_45_10]
MDPKKILLVEDDNFIRELYQRELEKAGYKVSTAVNGKLALEVARSEKFDLILLDIMIPEIDGFKVLETLKGESKTRNTDVIILSNLGQDDLLNKALKIGARAYILKSSTVPSQVLQEVRSILD